MPRVAGDEPACRAVPSRSPRRDTRRWGASKVTGSNNVARLAVLIDADNAQPAAIEALLAEVAKFGTAHVKRAYGDWTGTSL